MSAAQLTRQEILAALVDAFRPQEYAHALWEGGSTAFGRADAWSDIDLYLVADEPAIPEAFRLAQASLEALSPIDLVYEVGQTPWPGVFQTFYRLQNANPYLLIDLAVIRLSDPLPFLEVELHGEARVLFDKQGIIRPPAFDWQANRSAIRTRLRSLRLRFEMFQVMILKELERGEPIDAMAFYQAFALRPLVEILRMTYQPTCYDFGPRYLHQVLPAEQAARLARLYYIPGFADLPAAREEAAAWFNKLANQLQPALEDNPE
jgi:predicted nucleotidyltransferase